MIRMNYIRIFTNIYEKNSWGKKANNRSAFSGSSGGHSSIRYTEKYNKFLINFILEHKITKVVDLGCGDWQSSHIIYNANPGIEYTGYDAYKKLIDSHTRMYPQYDFIHLDIIEDMYLIENADLYIIKDTLQYIKTNDIKNLLNYLIQFKKCKYIILCNSFNQSWENEECTNHQVGRGLIVGMNPLRSFSCKHLFYFNDKQVSILQLY
jgi:hypothetical protein